MLKVGIIGYGYMGEIRKRVVDASPRLALSGICERDKSKVQHLKGVTIYDRPESLLNSDTDIVCVCTPNNSIPDLVVRALDKGKHVFCEKPPGRNIHDVEKMRKAELQNQNCKLMFGFNHRYHPAILRAKKIVVGGSLGKVLWLRGLYGKSGGRHFRTSWRNRKEISGGGILLDQGIHMLDLFNYICSDSNFTNIKAVMGNKHWGGEVEDNAFIIMENGAGQHACLHSSATLWKHQFKLEIGLEDGYLTVEGFLSKTGSYGRESLTIGRRQFEDEAEAIGNPSEEIIYFDQDRSWEIEFASFVSCILENKPVVESTSLDALNAMSIVESAYEDSQYYISEEVNDGIFDSKFEAKSGGYQTGHRT